jgi:hypothetical protein
MSLFITFLLLAVQLLCLTLLGVSCFPGAMVNFIGTAMLLTYILAPFGLGGGIIWLLIWNWRRHKPDFNLENAPLLRRTQRYPRRLAIATGILLVSTVLLLQTNTPQKVAFAFSRPAFEARLNSQCNGVMVPQTLRIYRVEECIWDRKGGAYFKTGSHGFMFDQCTYGFVYQPNAQGSDRFGHGPYAYSPVSGDWAWFKACTDF